jgi:hypothetical protein
MGGEGGFRGMTKEDRETYWSLSFDTYYKAYYQELASQALAARWERIDVLTALLVAATASGSTLAGWALWSDVGWKVVWAGIAAVATITSILHGSLRVPSRLKEQEELRREFSGLRVDLAGISDMDHVRFPLVLLSGPRDASRSPPGHS